MLIRRASSDLNFVKSKCSLPTVEIQIESLETKKLSFPKIVCEALANFAKKNPKIHSTIWLYGTVSTNFHKYGWSEFLAVAGPINVLEALFEAFNSIPGVECRYSDYIDPKQGRRVFHVEEGRLWEIEDARSWFSSGPVTGGDASMVEETESGVEEEADDEPLDATNLGLDKEENDLSDETEVARRQSQGVRFRAARSDASIESIRQKIEQTFGLPEGSVALCGPDGRPMRKDAFIRTLRRRWEDA